MTTKSRKSKNSSKPGKITIKQFDEKWIPHHNSLYVGFGAWMAENTAAKFEWFNALGEFTLDELIEASRIHFRWPNGSKAENYSRQLADLLDIAKKSRVIQSYETDARSYARKCGMCRGTGQVSAIARQGYSFPGNRGKGLRQATAACKCGAGDKFRDRFNTFDPDTMELWDVVNAVDRAQRVESIIQSREARGDHRFAAAMRDFLAGKIGPREFIGGRASSSAGPAVIEAGPTRSIASPVMDWDGAPVRFEGFPEDVSPNASGANVGDLDADLDSWPEDDPAGVAGLGPNDPPPDDEVPF